MPMVMPFRRNRVDATATLDLSRAILEPPSDGSRAPGRNGGPDRRRRAMTAALASRARIDGLAGLCTLILVVSGLGLPLPGGHLAADAILVVVGLQLGLAVTRLAGGSPRWLRRFWFGAIGPVVVPTLVAVALVGAYWWWLDRLGPVEIRGTIASLAMVTNLTPLMTEAGFAATEHLWLISLIVQFAVLVPLAVVITRRPDGRRTMLRVIITVVAAVAVARLTMTTIGLAEPSTLARITPTRIDGLLVGLGLAVAPRSLIDRIAPAAGPLAMVTLLAVVALAPDPAAKPAISLGLLIPLAVVATAVVIAARNPTGDDALSRFLGSLGPRWLGERAISIYIWHRLFGMALSDELGGDLFGADWPGLGLFVTRLVFALAAGSASYRYLQLPLRAGIERVLDRRRDDRGRSIEPTAPPVLSPG